MTDHPKRRHRNRYSKGTPGRPRADASFSKSHYLSVRITESQYRMLKAQAAEHSLSVSQLARAAVLSQKLRPPSIPKANFVYVGELNHLGNNLNQLLVLIYTNRAPLGLLSTLRQLQHTVNKVKAMMLGYPIEGEETATQEVSQTTPSQADE